MQFIRSLFFNTRLYVCIAANVLLFVIAASFPPLLLAAKLALAGIVVLIVTDMLLLFATAHAIAGERAMAERFSNGDDNEIVITIDSRYAFPVKLMVIDEVPPIFQRRDMHFDTTIKPFGSKRITYHLKPTERGEYSFGALNIYATGIIGFVSRRFTFDRDKMIPVYPSYLQMRKYELIAISNRLTEYGHKQIRKIGHSMEFEKIREYVVGDDYRNVNWNATARANRLMINQFQDERSQQVYSVIDKGRLMKMPFDGMTLLDYAINASLVISNIALKRSDKAGLITFGNKIGTVLAAASRGTQMSKIQEALYREQTNFLDSNFEALSGFTSHKLSQRSLVLLYTNFETVASMKRQLPYIKSIASKHLVVVIFFENTELKSLINGNANTIEEIYHQTIAEKFAYEKRLIVKELKSHGIQSMLTTPANLTIDSLNKYLEIKAREML